MIPIAASCRHTRHNPSVMKQIMCAGRWCRALLHSEVIKSEFVLGIHQTSRCMLWALESTPDSTIVVICFQHTTHS